MGIAEEVFELLEPLVTTAGAELFDVEWSGTVLRVLVDAEEGIEVDALAKINRLISPILDEDDPIPGRYTLEVSSPGVERKLSKESHYEGAVGEHVVVKTLPGHTPRRVRGELKSFSENTITVAAIEIDGTDQKSPEDYSFSLDEIDRTKTVFNWGPTPKTGGKQNQGKQQGSGNNKPGNKKPSSNKSNNKSKQKPSNS
jgi:ribosome maturation factor RimP